MRKRQSKKMHPQRRIFLVVCEGETEKAYVELLKRHYRLPITIKTKVSGNAINQRLVNRYLSELDLKKGDDYEVFYMYDSDVQCVIDKILSLPGTAILTNPCIELWYILHHQNHTREVNSDAVVKALMTIHDSWRCYTKGRLNKEQQNILIQNRHFASDRAKSLNYPYNPSSNMYRFIEQLEKAEKG